MCVFKLQGWENENSQNVQWKSLILRWTPLLCILRSPLWKNFLSQTSQENFFSLFPCLNCQWSWASCFVWNFLLQVSHWNFFSLIGLLWVFIKGGTANFSSCSLDVIQHLSLKTYQYFIIILSISCQYISVDPLVRIEFMILHLLTAQFNSNSPKENKMDTATIEANFRTGIKLGCFRHVLKSVKA